MAFNKQPPAASSFLFLITLIFLMGLAPLWAQNSGYYMELRFIQRLTWAGDDYAMRYEVIIEKEEEENAGKYNRVVREFTEADFIEVSLPPGKYRYQVIPHDFFDQPIPVSEWMDFEILRAVTQEQLDSLMPGKQEDIPAEPGEPEMIETEIAETEPVEPESPPAPEPEKIVEYKNLFDIYLGAAWIPLLPIYGENEFFGANVSLFGAGARIGIVSAKQSVMGAGLELIASWRAYENNSGDSSVQSLTFDFNVLAQNRFRGGRTALNLRLGAGVSLLSDIDPVSATGRYSIHANLGVSFLWLILSNFYMEAGADYSQYFTDDYFGFFRPWIGLGARF